MVLYWGYIDVLWGLINHHMRGEEFTNRQRGHLLVSLAIGPMFWGGLEFGALLVLWAIARKIGKGGTTWNQPATFFYRLIIDVAILGVILAVSMLIWERIYIVTSSLVKMLRFLNIFSILSITMFQRGGGYGYWF